MTILLNWNSSVQNYAFQMAYEYLLKWCQDTSPFQNLDICLPPISGCQDDDWDVSLRCRGTYFRGNILLPALICVKGMQVRGMFMKVL